MADVGEPFIPQSAARVGSSHAGETWELRGRDGFLFVKKGPLSVVADLEAEHAGLARLAAAHAVRMPRPVALVRCADTACLVIEGIRLEEPADTDAWSRLGFSLAALHACPVSVINRRLPETLRMPEDSFGADLSGSVLSCQPGWFGTESSWGEAFVVGRLVPQLERAERTGLTLPRRGPLLERCLALLSHTPKPSLVHGDLWRGNVGFSSKGEAVVFDPAPYLADAETDLAMTRLFGGFPPEFYEAYGRTLPPCEGWELRSQAYDLYHVLNHHNLFGGGYGIQAAALAHDIAAGRKASKL